MDNASNMDTLATELAALLPGVFDGLAARVRCFAHIVNLAARKGMSVFDATNEEIKKAAAELCTELTGMGEDLTEVSISEGGGEDDSRTEEQGIDVDWTEMAGLTAEEENIFCGASIPLRNTIQKVRTVCVNVNATDTLLLDAGTISVIGGGRRSLSVIGISYGSL